MPPNFEQGVVFYYINLSDLALILPDNVRDETVSRLLPCRNGRMLVRQPYFDIMKHLYTKAREALRSSLAKKQVKDTITVLGSTGSGNLKRSASPTALQGEPLSKIRTRDMSHAQKIQTAARALEERHVIITGHPGIGRTYFLSFIHYSRTLLGQESIIQVRKNWHFHFSAAGVVEFQSIAQAKETGLISRDILSNENIWYVSDGQPDDIAVYESNWMIIVISSPKAETFKDFQKQFSVETLYMPPFSWNEIFATSVFCEFLKGDQIYTVWRNFVLYGPSARILLNVLRPQSAGYQAALQTYKKKLQMKIRNMLRSDFTKQIQEKWLDTDLHAVILTTPSHANFLQEPVRSFITPYVGQLFATTQDAMVRGDGAKLFHALENVPEGSTYRGRIFEALFHKLMERKTIVLYQTIGNPYGAPVAFLPCKTHVFNRLPLFTDMIRVKKGSPNVNRDYLGTYFRPVIPNFQSVDSFALLDGMVLVFQITCAQSHPVKATGLAELCAAMPHEAQTWPWRLVFVLPEKQVATWKVQEIKCFDNQELVDRWAGIGQEVMGVPDSVLHKELDER